MGSGNPYDMFLPIVHWNGQVLSAIPLPPDLAAAPPTWRAISGAGPDYVWFAGTQGAVARWDGMQLTSVGLIASNDVPVLTANPQAKQDWAGVAVANAQMDDVFFVSSQNTIGHFYKGSMGVQTGALTMSYRTYPIMAKPPLYPVGAMLTLSGAHCISTQECWFSGHDPNFGGIVIQAYSYANDGNYIYTDYSMTDSSLSAPGTPVTSAALNGIWGIFTGAVNREVVAVGTGGTVIYSGNSSTTGQTNQTFYPYFGSPCPGGVCPSPITSMNLNAVGGTAPSDVWIAADGGGLFHFDTGNMSPYVAKTSMTSANLTSIFSIGNRIYAAGQSKVLITVLTP